MQSSTIPTAISNTSHKIGEITSGTVANNDLIENTVFRKCKLLEVSGLKVLTFGKIPWKIGFLDVQNFLVLLVIWALMLGGALECVFVLAKLKVKAKRVNITLPENLLHEIDRYAEQYHMTRSGLLAQAADQYIHRKQLA
jgi:hypothetical protein